MPKKGQTEEQIVAAREALFSVRCRSRAADR